VQRPPTSAKVTQLFEDLGEELAGRGVSTSKMFGMPCLKAKKSSFAGLWGDAMVFKLTGESLAVATKLKGAALFDPMGGRPMKEWVVVPATHAKRWRELAEAALDYVAG
jgi:hypothetical protein